MFDHILIPIEQNNIADIVLAEVRSLLSPGGKVTLLAAAQSLDSEPASLKDWRVTEILRSLDPLAESLRGAGIHVEIAVQHGKLPELTDPIAHELKVDAIVLVDSEAPDLIPPCPGFAQVVRVVVSDRSELYYG